MDNLIKLLKLQITILIILLAMEVLSLIKKIIALCFRSKDQGDYQFTSIAAYTYIILIDLRNTSVFSKLGQDLILFFIVLDNCPSDCGNYSTNCSDNELGLSISTNKCFKCFVDAFVNSDSERNDFTEYTKNQVSIYDTGITYAFFVKVIILFIEMHKIG